MNPLKNIIDQEITYIVPANYSVVTSNAVMRAIKKKKEAKLQRIENLKLALLLFLVVGFCYYLDSQNISFSLEISKKFMKNIVLNGIGIGLLVALFISEYQMNNKKSFIK